MRAGQLRHRVTLQSVTRTDDEGGGYSEAWADDATVWAAVEPLEGTEALRGMALTATVTHRIWLRYREGVTAAMRVQHDGRTFNVRSVIDPEERHRELVLLAEEQR